MLPPAVRAKLQPLILMLSSEYAGEQQAAAAAIGRVLKANDLSFHDLADVIAEESPPPSAPPPAVRSEPQLWQRDDGRFEIPAGDLLPLIQAIRESGVWDSRTADFLDGMQDRADRWSIVIISQKQLSWLTDLLRRVR